nr:Rieske 2Fe-2S domain-containing protein [Gammaproteobacteria bacterium]
MTRQKETMDQLLARIKTLSELPLNRAHTMPPDIYHSNEWYERELKNIFYQDWSCAGLSADIPEPGDYLTWRIGDQPVFVMRQRDGSLKALANVCRHRMMPLLEGHGRC